MAAVFFHKGITRLRAEELLLEAEADGSFLVRDSESVAGAYVLCLLHQRRVHQYRILPDKEGRISVQSEGDMQPPCYSDLPSLVTSYIGKGDKNGLVCAMRGPVGPEGLVAEEVDSEEDEFEDAKQSVDDKSGLPKTFKFGLLNNFARLDLSSIDGEFVDAMKCYVDQGLEKDATMAAGDGASAYPMPEFQKLIAVAGKGLQRELDVFLLKMSMCQDMLSNEDDDKRKTISSNPMDRLGSYIDFMAAKLETCRSQVLALEKKAQEAVAPKEGEDEEENGEEYAYPDATDLSRRDTVGHPFVPLALRRSGSVNIPLSTFEVKVLKYGKANQKLKLTVDIHQGRFFAVKPSKDFLDASNTFPHDKILQLVKNTTDNSRLNLIMDKKKASYQFENALARESFCLQIRQMKSLHSQEVDVDNVSVFIGSWNMGKSAPVNSLKSWLKCSGEVGGRGKDRVLSRVPHDIYVIGTQESAMTEKDWINTIKAALKASMNCDVDLLDSCSLWGIRTLIFINPKHKNKVSHIQKSSVRTGIANALGNKGASAISFLLSGTSFCFINAHLTSGEERLDRRNANFRDILKSLSLGPKNLEGYDVTHKFHHVFFFGDLNYRVTEPVELVLRRLERRDFHDLLEQDQLRRVQHEKKAFFRFKESDITFMPTYRLERHTLGYKYDWKKIKATSERINVPSWCDRVLWHSFPGTFIENTAYGCAENMLNSDHRPVFSSFTVGIASPFIQNRASLQDNFNVKFIFKSIEAQIKTSTKQFYILEFSSTCLPDIICCESNKRFGESQKAGFTNNPVWTADQLPQLRPLFGDADFLEDQHLLIAVKGSGDDHESYGECVISLKELFAGETCTFNTTMTHYGEETGQMSGEWYISSAAGVPKQKMRSSRKTYDFIYLDTEYRDPEEFLSLSPPVVDSEPSSPFLLASGTQAGEASTSPGPLTGDQDTEGSSHHYVNHKLIRRLPSDPVPECPSPKVGNKGDNPPPLPSKKAKGMSGTKETSEAPNAGVFFPSGDSSSLSGSRAQKYPSVTQGASASPLPQHRALPDTPPPSSPSVGKVKAKSSGFRPGSKAKEHELQQTSGAQAAWADGAGQVLPSAPPMPEQEIYPSIAIRKYEELKKPQTVGEWLMGLGLPEYTALFLRSGFDSMSALHGLNAASIMKVGIRNGEHSMRILNSVRDMKGTSL